MSRRFSRYEGTGRKVGTRPSLSPYNQALYLVTVRPCLLHQAAQGATYLSASPAHLVTLQIPALPKRRQNYSPRQCVYVSTSVCVRAWLGALARTAALMCRNVCMRGYVAFYAGVCGDRSVCTCLSAYKGALGCKNVHYWLAGDVKRAHTQKKKHHIQLPLY